MVSTWSKVHYADKSEQVNSMSSLQIPFFLARLSREYSSRLCPRRAKANKTMENNINSYKDCKVPDVKK
eukprot:270913-Ditylum_brightwellii.AAC.1